MYRLTTSLSDEDFVALRTLAHLDRRSPRDQARLILERYVARHRHRLERARPRPLQTTALPEPLVGA
jgi:hypothetical protein